MPFAPGHARPTGAASWRGASSSRLRSGGCHVPLGANLGAESATLRSLKVTTHCWAGQLGIDDEKKAARGMTELLQLRGQSRRAAVMTCCRSWRVRKPSCVPFPRGGSLSILRSEARSAKIGSGTGPQSAPNSAFKCVVDSCLTGGRRCTVSVRCGLARQALGPSLPFSGSWTFSVRSGDREPLLLGLQRLLQCRVLWSLIAASRGSLFYWLDMWAGCPFRCPRPID